MNLFQVTKKQDIEGYELRTMTGDIVSFMPSYSQLLPDPFSDLNIMVNVLATGGNGSPDNPISINGYSSVNITRCGVNLWDEEWDLSGTLVVSKYPIKVAPNTTYYIACPVTADIDSVSASGQYISYITSKTNGTFTTPADCNYIKFTMRSAYGTTYNNDIAILYPSTNHDYAPFNGQTYTIAFGQTVYGGVLDVTRGKLSNNTFGFVCDNSLVVSREGASGGVTVFKIVFANNDFPSGIDSTCVSSHFSRSIPSGTSGRLSQTASEIWGAIDTSLLPTDDSAGVKAWLSTNAVTFYYEITPFDIDLTPEVISAIVGTNNVFADCGETTVTCLI